MKKILTKLDTNLISYTSEEISDQSIVKNELLIKELVHTIKNDKKYVGRDQVQKLIKYEQVTTDVNQLLNATNKSNLQQVAALIFELVSKLNIRDKRIKELEDKLLEANLKTEKQHQEIEQQCQEIETISCQLEEVIAERDKFERKYIGQKERKVIKFADKLGRK